MPGSVPGPAFRPNLSELSVVFSRTRVNTGLDLLERPPTEGTLPLGPGPTSRQLALKPQPNSTQTQFAIYSRLLIELALDFPFFTFGRTQLLENVGQTHLYYAK